MSLSQIDVLAHTSAHGEQSLRDHLVQVSCRSCKLANKLGLPAAGALIGLLHDLGKGSTVFQKYLRSFTEGSGIEPQDELRGRIDHSTAGAQWLVLNMRDGGSLDRPGVVASLLALCIVSHHSGLIDCVLQEGGDGLATRLVKSLDKTYLNEATVAIDPEVLAEATRLLNGPELVSELFDKLRSILRGKADDGRVSGDGPVQVGILARLLFSCLIDADRTDTADFENPRAASFRQDGVYESWLVLLERLEAATAQLPAKGEVNRIRRAISAQCFAAAARPAGIYTLTVPTGGGKTLSALRFAMEHARRHGQDRVIFVSPYISIVDQNAAVVRRALEPAEAEFASVVLEHHSNLEEEENSKGESWRRKVVAENWDAPVVFTTMVQVLEALFGAGTRSVRRLHTLANAVLVFDEVQTLPVKLVHLFNNAVNLLMEHCGSTVLLCTATQPLLDRVCEKRGAARLAMPPELIADINATFLSLKRYTVTDQSDQPGGWTCEQVSELARSEARRRGSCLVIVNTKADALEIFQQCRALLGEAAHVAHLSTNMCPAHRMEVLSEVKLQLLHKSTTERPLICVSTQLIEAGVDIDFAVVVRDLAGLDSIAQAAGRCNRNGIREHPGQVHIVKLPDPPRALEQILKGRLVAERILGNWRRDHPAKPFPLDDPASMTEYFRHSFFQQEKEMVYPLKAGKGIVRESTMLDLLGGNKRSVHESGVTAKPITRPLLHQSFKSANDAFALMEQTRGIVVPYGIGGAAVIAELAAAYDVASEWRLRREAQRYTISVYPQLFVKLAALKAIYELQSQGRASGVFCLRAEFYDKDAGLQIRAGGMDGLIA